MERMQREVSELPPKRHRSYPKWPVQFNSVQVEVDDDSGKALNLERVDRNIEQT